MIRRVSLAGLLIAALTSPIDVTAAGPRIRPPPRWIAPKVAPHTAETPRVVPKERDVLEDKRDHDDDDQKADRSEENEESDGGSCQEVCDAS